MKYIIRIICAILVYLTANFPVLLYYERNHLLLILFITGYIFLNIIPSYHNNRIPLKRHRICADGCELLMIFLISVTASGLSMILMLQAVFPKHMGIWFLNLLTVILAEGIVFWNGILRVYCTSVQLGLKWRTIGIVCGFIPIVNLIILYRLIQISSAEVIFESKKLIQAQEIGADKVCQTKYPILLVHGVFFRDFKYFNYWGRIPAELERYGAKIYYGNHQSASSVAESGEELAQRITQIVTETGCGKVNVIAHSKGGLDCRYAISMLGADQQVATLTTINTPHRGCIFADYLLDKIPQQIKDKVAGTYNAALKKLGDTNPDFIKAVTDLTASSCEQFNKIVLDMPEVYYQSIGSKLNIPSGGRFPLNFSNRLVKHFDGSNDGLVAEHSFPWGKNHRFLTTGKRGISHGDMIDLNRENMKDFDVRDFYVSLVKELKEAGY